MEHSRLAKRIVTELVTKGGLGSLYNQRYVIRLSECDHNLDTGLIYLLSQGVPLWFLKRKMKYIITFCLKVDNGYNTIGSTLGDLSPSKEEATHKCQLNGEWVLHASSSRVYEYDTGKCHEILLGMGLVDNQKENAWMWRLEDTILDIHVNTNKILNLWLQTSSRWLQKTKTKCKHCGKKTKHGFSNRLKIIKVYKDACINGGLFKYQLTLCDSCFHNYILISEDFVKSRKENEEILVRMKLSENHIILNKAYDTIANIQSETISMYDLMNAYVRSRGSVKAWLKKYDIKHVGVVNRRQQYPKADVLEMMLAREGDALKYLNQKAGIYYQLDVDLIPIKVV